MGKPTRAAAIEKERYDDNWKMLPEFQPKPSNLPHSPCTNYLGGGGMQLVASPLSARRAADQHREHRNIAG